ncbi:sensor histidine kinase [Brevundimonas sp. P7753]|uniref:sensor histidine kinase n=1 Tax=Brevundimonas sp. P7753 TaxID=2726982 RepID=UPI0015BB6716|nr:sensor histidine kinase [Brevundimonas sp. P7753]NWE53817.1 sensor histidine kinase [Brevundimonas sp. P7753]
MTRAPDIVEEGTLGFTIEGRVLRELGERLVKQPEVAIVELVKNAYDADATDCTITYIPNRSIIVEDNGVGMTFGRFRDGWMRIGTSSKEGARLTDRYLRLITGEKGIGRFAVRFLGRGLQLDTVADDPDRGYRTRLSATFDWPQFDKHADLGTVKVPYSVERVDGDEPLGTSLTITKIRSEARRLDLKKVRSGSIDILTPLRSMFRDATGENIEGGIDVGSRDPGFSLTIQDVDDVVEDVASEILEAYTFRAVLDLKGEHLDLKVFRRGYKAPYLKIVDTFPNGIGNAYADIRFFPRREGAFAGLSVDGRYAYSWIVANSGVAVFDRNFRVQPYGGTKDDWLRLQADAARNRRDPRSSLAAKHFPMSNEVRAAPSENWMIRLPQSAQLVGLVQVQGKRNAELEAEHTADEEERGLIASADREGFVENETFEEFTDVIRGVVEAIAFADRKLQQEEEQRRRDENAASLKRDTQSAIREIRADPNIAAPTKERIVAVLADQQKRADVQEETSRERERQLEVMSLLGVVAGFMTHEFGVAIQELETTHQELIELAKDNPRFDPVVASFATHIGSLNEFVKYSSGYIQGTKILPTAAYPVRPRLQRVKRVFGRYAEERNIDVEISAESDLLAPLVPASLYDGIALNLYTNALKAVTGKTSVERGVIAFRSWNEGRWHYLEVSDTGVGIPGPLQSKVFDPLFTTTASRNDPLGSGMGLGLALVRRGAEAFGGKAELTTPPPNFATCIRVRLPINLERTST